MAEQPPRIPDSISNNYTLREAEVPLPGVEGQEQATGLIVAESRAHHSYGREGRPVEVWTGEPQPHEKVRGIVNTDTELGGKPFTVAERPQSGSAEPHSEERAQDDANPQAGNQDDWEEVDGIIVDDPVGESGTGSPRAGADGPTGEQGQPTLSEDQRAEAEAGESEPPSQPLGESEPEEPVNPEPSPEQEPPTPEELAAAAAERINYFADAKHLRDKRYVPTAEEFAEMRELRSHLEMGQETYPGQHAGEPEQLGAIFYHVGGRRIDSFGARTFMDNTRFDRWVFKDEADLGYVERVLHAQPADIEALKNRRYEQRQNFLTYNEFRASEIAHARRGNDEAVLRRYQAYMERRKELDGEIVTDAQYRSDPEFGQFLTDRRTEVMDGALRTYRARLETQRLQRQARRAERVESAVRATKLVMGIGRTAVSKMVDRASDLAFLIKDVGYSAAELSKRQIGIARDIGFISLGHMIGTDEIVQIILNSPNESENSEEEADEV